MAMKPLDRKILLMRRGVTMAAIGRALGVTRNHVVRVVSGKGRSPTVEAEVARVLGLSAVRVFGKPPVRQAPKSPALRALMRRAAVQAPQSGARKSA